MNALSPLGMVSETPSSNQFTIEGPEAEKDYFVEKDGMKFAGMHLLIDLWGASNLCDPDHIDRFRHDLGASLSRRGFLGRLGATGLAAASAPSLLADEVAAVRTGSETPTNVTGIAQVVFAFSLHVSAGGRVLLFVSGAASLILAVLCFRSLQDSILLLAIWIGIGFIFRGVATAVSAISDPMLPGRWWEIFIGGITLLAGVIVLASPFESIATLTLVVGIWLIVIGVFEAVSAFGIRSASKSLAAPSEGPDKAEVT